MTTTKMTTLPNGLRIVTDTISAVETATLGVWVDVGARHEDESVNGISHVLEHMAFKGTIKRSPQQIAEEIEAVGGYLNAYTSREMTAYHARILKEDVPLAMDVLSDILQNSVFDTGEFEKEQSVIIQEIAQSYDTPDDIVFDYFQECCYPNQALGRPILGTADLVQSFTAQNVHDYMKNHYGAHQMVLAAAGKIDHDHIVDLAQTFFKDLPHRPLAPIEPARFKGGIDRRHKELEQAHVLLGYEGVPFGHPDYYAASILSAILGGGISSRLFQEIREKRGLVYSIYAYSTSYRDTGQFAIYAGTRPDQVQELLPVVHDELKKISSTLNEIDVQRAKAQLKAGLMMGLESTSNRCEAAARQIMIHGKPTTPQIVLEKVNAVNSDQLIRLAETLFSSPAALTIFGQLDQVPDTFSDIF